MYLEHEFVVYLLWRRLATSQSLLRDTEGIVCRATQETSCAVPNSRQCLLCETAVTASSLTQLTMSALGRSRHICCITHQTMTTLGSSRTCLLSCSR